MTAAVTARHYGCTRTGRLCSKWTVFISQRARSITASSDLDLGSHDDGALGGEGESVTRVGGVAGE